MICLKYPEHEQERHNSATGPSCTEPDWSADARLDLSSGLNSLNENWHVWNLWYQSISNGQSAWYLNPKIAEKLAAHIAFQENIFWDRRVGVINAEITEWHREIWGTDKSRESPYETLFVSYANQNEGFARWVVDVVELAGYSTVVQYRDFELGNNFVREMQEGLGRADRMIALLSPEYEKSDHCQAEWAAFYNQDPSGTKRKLIPLMIGKTDLNELAKQIVYSRIFDLSPEQAKQKILSAIGYRGNVETPDGWPGGNILNKLRGAGTGVYDVQPDTDNRLQEIPTQASEENIAGFPPEQIFDEIRDQANDLCEKLKSKTDNQFYSSALNGRAKDWADAMAQSLDKCNPLVLNKKIVWLLQTFAFDVAQGNLAKADHVQMYVRDLHVYYKRLALIFPNLKPYREANARERFELPSDDENEAFKIVFDFFGDEQSSGEIFNDLLIKSLRQVGEDRNAAREIPASDDSEEARNVKVEAEFDAGNRTIAIGAG